MIFSQVRHWDSCLSTTGEGEGEEVSQNRNRRIWDHFDTESLSLNIDRCGSHFFLFPFKTLGKQSGETERTERFIRRSAASIPGTEYYSGDSRNRCASGMEAATLEGRTPFFSLLYPDPKLPIESKSPVPLFENTEKSSSPLCIIHTQGGRTKSRANTWEYSLESPLWTKKKKKITPIRGNSSTEHQQERKGREGRGEEETIAISSFFLLFC